MRRFALLAVALILVACEKQGPLERAGEKIDDAVGNIKSGGETPGDKIDDAVDAVKKAANDASDELKQ
jgi:hypothetical protein